MTHSSWFSQLGIKGRILSMIWVSVVMASGVVGINYWAKTQQAAQQEVQTRLLDNMMLIKDFGMEIKSLGLAAMDALVDADSGHVSKEVADDVADFDRYLQEHRQKLLDIGQELGKSAEARVMFSHVDAMAALTQELLRKVTDKGSTSRSFASLDDDVDKSQTNAFHLSQELAKAALAMHEESVEIVTKMTRTMTYLTLGANGTLILALLMLGLTTAKSITKGTNQSSAQLTQTVTALAHAVSDLDKAGHTLAGTATEQNASVTETVSAMTEIQSVIKRSSENSKTVVYLAKEAKGRSEEGSALMNQLSQAVTAVKLANQELEEIKKIFQKIETKTAIVNNISFKTQLLSFNASIEAARAGANGRGFAVVALEVGRLADMSAKAADEIGGMLKESVASVAGIVERLSSKVEEASLTNTKALSQFSHIVSDINDISGKVSEIEHGISEQSAGVDQCVKAMHQLSLASQSNDELSTDITGLSHTLQVRTQELEATVVQLNRVIRGKNAAKKLELNRPAGQSDKKSLASASQAQATDTRRELKSVTDQALQDDVIIDEIASATSRLIQSAPRAPEEETRPTRKSA